MLIKVVAVKPLANYHIWLKFNDDTEGVADLSHLSKKGVFKQWDENNLFNQVKIDPETDAVIWNDRIDVDAINLYLKIKHIPTFSTAITTTLPNHSPL
jgi:hypothetical protein